MDNHYTMDNIHLLHNTKL